MFRWSFQLVFIYGYWFAMTYFGAFRTLLRRVRMRLSCVLYGPRTSEVASKRLQESSRRRSGPSQVLSKPRVLRGFLNISIDSADFVHECFNTATECVGTSLRRSMMSLRWVTRSLGARQGVSDSALWRVRPRLWGSQEASERRQVPTWEPSDPVFYGGF